MPTATDITTLATTPTFSATRLPPSAPEVEEILLGAVFLDSMALDVCLEVGLRSNHFSVAANRLIFEGFCALGAVDRAIDSVTVARWAQDRGVLVDIGGEHRLKELEFVCPSADIARDYAQIVFDKARSRSMIEFGDRIVKLGHDESTPIDDRYGTAQTLLADAMESGGKRRAVTLADIGADYSKEFEDALQRQRNDSFVSTGHPSLDRLLKGGLARGKVAVLCGRPSMGKSLVAVSIAKNIARDGLPVLYFSLEMTGRDIFERMIASEAQIPADRLRQPWTLSENMRMGARAAKDQLSSLPMFVYDDPLLSMTAIRARARRAVMQLGQIGAIFIDHVGIMKEVKDAEARGKSSDLVSILGAISSDICALGKETQAPIVPLFQLSRALEARNDKRPIPADLRGSGRIEENADNILGVYRPRAYDPEASPADIEIIGMKGRTTGTGIAEMLVDLPKSSLEEKSDFYGGSRYATDSSQY